MTINPVNFEFAYGSVMGSDHKLYGKNCQDYGNIRLGNDVVVGIVADGCGSAEHSEVGARIVTEAILADLFYYLSTHAEIYKYDVNKIPKEQILKKVDQSVELALLTVFRYYKDNHIDTNDLLTTIVGFIILPEYSWFFVYGDGMIEINGVWESVITDELGYPQYPIYNVMNNKPAVPQLTTISKTKNLFTFSVGTDGVRYLLDAFPKGKTYPGKKELVEPGCTLLHKDSNFSNIEGLQTTLQKLNRDSVTIDREKDRLVKHKGLLNDDTTLIVGRRKLDAEGLY
jgi:hypothetical protein